MIKSSTVKGSNNLPRPKHPQAPKSRQGTEAAARQKSQTKESFLHWYEQGGAIYWAAFKSGVSTDTIDRWRKEDAEFDNAVMSAFQRSTDNLKVTAYIRAMKGESKGSDSLMMFLIKQRDPSYRESFGIEGRHLHAGVISTGSKVPPAVQAAVDVMALELVVKMAEKL